MCYSFSLRSAWEGEGFLVRCPACPQKRTFRSVSSAKAHIAKQHAGHRVMAEGGDAAEHKSEEQYLNFFIFFK